ncbi:ATP-binding protein [uncultured Bacteroides sp.]|uniref:ATP-binding protein n=1 Tax=uncultured Bacteroides sp. TaxID=162156 RepID=UPI002AAB8757|nr:ATP-binding protein [uncultured Bacteroides sp.]
MIQKEFLQEILKQQKEHLAHRDVGMLRDGLGSLPDIDNYALIVSGVRRCGKSTLLYQLLKKSHTKTLYINFDDPRLYDFELSDFQKLDALIKESENNVLMFDEIQIIKGWERYVRQKLDENYKIFVTGSNASLLSRELGTSLTGRHITTELFPFSYHEFCLFKHLEANKESVIEYMRNGGFPEFLKTSSEEILANLLDDILIRDIAVRYGIKDTRGLKRLTIYLLSNIGNLTSANKLREPSGLNSTTTVLEYLSHLEQSYLISLVPMFDYSLKKQAINPKKIYAIDLGLVNANVSKIKGDEGHKLENMVYNKLRSKFKEIYYHKGKVECDFIVLDKGTITQAIQVCLQLDTDNKEREFAGLIDALKKYHLSEGIIVTLSQDDIFEIDGFTIRLVPSFQFFNS